MAGFRRSSGSRALARTRVDESVVVGSLTFPHAVMCASGTAGHGAELASYFALSDVGAVITKSLHPDPWPGNPAPRLHQTPAGMINAVGLQGPGVQGWIDSYLGDLVESGARIVASIWGRSIEEYGRAAASLTPVADRITALEVNVSCPNVEDRDRMFAHSGEATRAAIEASQVAGLPMWAKLSPNIGDLVPIASAARAGGAEAVTLSNTLIGIAIDIEKRKPVLSNGRGGVSGPGIRPVSLRTVYDVHQAMPDFPIVGVGGVSSGESAVEYLMAGASAVQVGTATFAEPRAAVRIRHELADWCGSHGVTTVASLTGTAHA